MKFTSYIFGALILPLLALSDVASAAYTPPNLVASGIPEPGFPDFLHDVKLSFAKVSGGYKLTATQTSSGFTFNETPTQSWSGTNGSFSLTAYFNSSLGFKSGSVTLKGKIPGYDGSGSLNTGSGSIQTNTQTLFSSSLTAANFDLSPVGLGFKTSYANAKGWAKQFMSADESVWFYNANILTSLLNGKTFSVNAKAITTVPVPAAAWLFGSGLMTLLASRRRQSVDRLAG